MKGSPILATMLACFIMLVMYAGMRVAFSKDDPPVLEPNISSPSPSGKVSVYAEIYFSSRPKNFSITHPDSGLSILNITDHDASEWSGELFIPVEKLTSGEIEFLGKCTWKSPEDGHQFMQIIISPEDLDQQTHTLRAEGDIADIITFHWKEEEK